MKLDLEKYPERLYDVIKKATPNIVAKLKLSPDDARAAAFEVTEIIRTEWGGSNHYLSKGISFELSRRDWELYGEFNGVNQEYLRHKFGTAGKPLTLRRVYQIIEACRSEEFVRNQPNLTDQAGNEWTVSG